MVKSRKTSGAKPVVIQVAESFGGGVFQSMSQLCMGLQKDADFVMIHGRRAETPDNFEASFPKGTRFIEIATSREVNPKQDLKSALHLRKLVKSLKTEYGAIAAIHAHSSKAGALARVGLIGLGIPVYYSPRGYAFQMKAASIKKRAFYWLVERVLGLTPSTTIACGYDELSAARTVSLFSTVVPNAIHLKSVEPSQRQRPAVKKELIIVGSGRISPQKNFPLFCDIARHFLGQPVRFIWVGGGESPELANLPKNMEVTGWLPHAEALKNLNRGHIYLHMSAWEGLSRIVLEAMSHGYPLILSDIPGNRELASAGNGFLCQDGADAIAAIKSFLNNPAQLQQMSTASLNHLATHYDWERTLPQWQKLYGITPGN